MRFRSFVVAIGLAITIPAQATILKSLDIDALVERSHLIVVGVVGRQRTVTPDGRVLTESRIQVERTLHGTTVDTVRVYQLGGHVDDAILDVPGTARLAPRSRVLLMLVEERDGRHYIAGMAQGAFRVDGDKLIQTVDVALSDGRRILPPPGVRELSLADVEVVIGRVKP